MNQGFFDRREQPPRVLPAPDLRDVYAPSALAVWGPFGKPPKGSNRTQDAASGCDFRNH
jgi:hypothetical protein